MDKKNCEFVLKHTDYEPRGYKYAKEMVSSFREKMVIARDLYEWADAAEAKAAKDEWQHIADKEKNMLSKSKWAMAYAEEKCAYHSAREEFDRCAYYQDVLIKAKLYYESILETDKMPETADIQDEVEDGLVRPSPLMPVLPSTRLFDNNLSTCDINRAADAAGAEVATPATEGEVTAEDDLDDDGLVGGTKAKATRDRQGRKNKYQPKMDKRNDSDVQQSKMQKPPKGYTSYQKLISQKSFSVPGKETGVDVSKEGYVFENGFLFCRPCCKRVSWPNRAQHLGSAVHEKKKREEIEKKQSAEKGGCQNCTGSDSKR